MKRIWAAKVLTVLGKGKTMIENGIRTYTPGRTGWVTIRTFEDFVEADEWLCAYARERHLCSSGIRVTEVK